MKCDRIEIFCNEIMQGSSQRKAYRAAYPSSVKWKDNVVDSKASVFAKDGSVMAKLDELRNVIEKDNKITRNDIIEQVKTIGFSTINQDDIKVSDKLKALETLIKILGYDVNNSNCDDNGNIVGAVILPSIKNKKEGENDENKRITGGF